MVVGVRRRGHVIARGQRVGPHRLARASRPQGGRPVCAACAGIFAYGEETVARGTCGRKGRCSSSPPWRTITALEGGISSTRPAGPRTARRRSAGRRRRRRNHIFFRVEPVHGLDVGRGEERPRDALGRVAHRPQAARRPRCRRSPAPSARPRADGGLLDQPDRALQRGERILLQPVRQRERNTTSVSVEPWTPANSPGSIASIRSRRRFWKSPT